MAQMAQKFGIVVSPTDSGGNTPPAPPQPPAPQPQPPAPQPDNTVTQTQKRNLKITIGLCVVLLLGCGAAWKVVHPNHRMYIYAVAALLVAIIGILSWKHSQVGK